MSVILSRSCEYALQAVLYLSHKSTDEPVALHEISATLNVPHHFLSKILQSLSRSRIVVSRRGINGGFLLAKKASSITIYDIIRSIDGVEFIDECILGFPGCGNTPPCPIHDSWKSAKVILLDIFQRKTIEELGKDLVPKLDFIQQLLSKKIL
ncbi:MAG: RrF2 family transcriptional regulator [Bacteroidota bacterium]